MTNRDGSMLDADAILIGPLAGKCRNVAHGIDIGDARVHARVDLDATNDLLTPQLLGELEPRRLSDSHDHQVGIDFFATNEAYAGRDVVAGDLLDPHSRTHHNAPVRCPLQNTFGNF